jgi:5-oxoprolinase (ATP-hydrolysing)
VVEINERVTPEEYTEDPEPKSPSELDSLVDDVTVVKGIGGELIRIVKPLGTLLMAYVFPVAKLV